MGGKNSKVMIILVAVVVIMAIALLYAFVIKPSYSGYVTNLQNQGAALGINYTLSSIMYLIQQNGGYADLPVPGTNQSVRLFISTVIPQLCSQLYQVNTTSK